MTLGYHASGMVFTSKGQGHSVTKSEKHIEGDRLVGVNLYLYRVLYYVFGSNLQWLQRLHESE